MQEQQSDFITVTIRLIKSFQYKNIKNLVLKDISTDQSLHSFHDLIQRSKIFSLF